MGAVHVCNMAEREVAATSGCAADKITRTEGGQGSVGWWGGWDDG